MKIDWKKIDWKAVVKDCFKVLIGAVLGASSGCASLPVIFF